MGSATKQLHMTMLHVPDARVKSTDHTFMIFIHSVEYCCRLLSVICITSSMQLDCSLNFKDSTRSLHVVKKHVYLAIWILKNVDICHVSDNGSSQTGHRAGLKVWTYLVVGLMSIYSGLLKLYLWTLYVFVIHKII